MKENKDNLEHVSYELRTQFIEMMKKNKDTILYVQYQPETIDDFLHHLVNNNYQLDDDVWSDHPNFEYFLIDMKEKSVTLVEEYWISLVQELEVPIFTDGTFKDVLLFDK